jgi:hypothetical protein
VLLFESSLILYAIVGYLTCPYIYNSNSTLFNMVLLFFISVILLSIIAKIIYFTYFLFSARYFDILFLLKFISWLNIFVRFWIKYIFNSIIVPANDVLILILIFGYYSWIFIFIEKVYSAYFLTLLISLVFRSFFMNIILFASIWDLFLSLLFGIYLFSNYSLMQRE